jgi:hypothetical protein
MTKQTEGVDALLELRRANFRRVTTLFGGPTRIAGLLGFKSGSYISQLASGHRPLTDKRSRAIEEKLNLDRGWLDKEHGGTPVFGELDPNNSWARIPGEAKLAAEESTPPTSSKLMSDVVHAIGAVLEESKIIAAPAKFATLVDLAFENAQLRGGVDEAFIRKIATLLK